MLTSRAELRALLRNPEGIDHLLTKGVSLCEVEEMLDQLEYEEALTRMSPPSWTVFGHLLWS